MVEMSNKIQQLYSQILAKLDLDIIIASVGICRYITCGQALFG